MAKDDDLNVLGRIARLLDVPVSAFYEPCATNAIAPSAQENSDLLEAFALIKDPQVRRECLDFVRAKAHGSRASAMPPKSDQP